MSDDLGLEIELTLSAQKLRQQLATEISGIKRDMQSALTDSIDLDKAIKGGSSSRRKVDLGYADFDTIRAENAIKNLGKSIRDIGSIKVGSFLSETSKEVEGVLKKMDRLRRAGDTLTIKMDASALRGMNKVLSQAAKETDTLGKSADRARKQFERLRNAGDRITAKADTDSLKRMKGLLSDSAKETDRLEREAESVRKKFEQINREVDQVESKQLEKMQRDSEELAKSLKKASQELRNLGEATQHYNSIKAKAVNEVNRRSSAQAFVDESLEPLRARELAGRKAAAVAEFERRQAAQRHLNSNLGRNTFAGKVGNAFSGKNAYRVDQIFQVQQALEDFSYAGLRGASNNVAYLASTIGGTGGVVAMLALMGMSLKDILGPLFQFGEESKEAAEKQEQLARSILTVAEAKRAVQADLARSASDVSRDFGREFEKPEVTDKRKQRIAAMRRAMQYGDSETIQGAIDEAVKASPEEFAKYRKSGKGIEADVQQLERVDRPRLNALKEQKAALDEIIKRRRSVNMMQNQSPEEAADKYRAQKEVEALEKKWFQIPKDPRAYAFFPNDTNFDLEKAGQYQSILGDQINEQQQKVLERQTKVAEYRKQAGERPRETTQDLLMQAQTDDAAADKVLEILDANEKTADIMRQQEQIMESLNEDFDKSVAAQGRILDGAANIRQRYAKMRQEIIEAGKETLNDLTEEEKRGEGINTVRENTRQRVENLNREEKELLDRLDQQKDSARELNSYANDLLSAAKQQSAEYGRQIDQQKSLIKNIDKQKRGSRDSFTSRGFDLMRDRGRFFMERAGFPEWMIQQRELNLYSRQAGMLSGQANAAGKAGDLERRIDLLKELQQVQLQVAGKTDNRGVAENAFAQAARTQHLIEQTYNQQKGAAQSQISTLQTLQSEADTLAAKLAAMPKIEITNLDDVARLQQMNLLLAQYRLQLEGMRGAGVPLPPAPPMKGFSRGGKLPGYGGGDRIPAVLEAGEYVFSKEAVRSIGADNLEGLHQHGRQTAMRGYAKGGMVSSEDTPDFKIRGPGGKIMYWHQGKYRTMQEIRDLSHKNAVAQGREFKHKTHYWRNGKSMTADEFHTGSEANYAHSGRNREAERASAWADKQVDDVRAARKASKEAQDRRDETFRRNDGRARPGLLGGRRARADARRIEQESARESRRQRFVNAGEEEEAMRTGGSAAVESLRQRRHNQVMAENERSLERMKRAGQPPAVPLPVATTGPSTDDMPILPPIAKENQQGRYYIPRPNFIPTAARVAAMERAAEAKKRITARAQMQRAERRANMAGRGNPASSFFGGGFGPYRGYGNTGWGNYYPRPRRQMMVNHFFGAWGMSPQQMNPFYGMMLGFADGGLVEGRDFIPGTDIGGGIVEEGGAGYDFMAQNFLGTIGPSPWDKQRDDVLRPHRGTRPGYFSDGSRQSRFSGGFSTQLAEGVRTDFTGALPGSYGTFSDGTNKSRYSGGFSQVLADSLGTGFSLILNDSFAMDPFGRRSGDYGYFSDGTAQSRYSGGFGFATGGYVSPEFSAALPTIAGGNHGPAPKWGGSISAGPAVYSPGPTFAGRSLSTAPPVVATAPDYGAGLGRFGTVAPAQTVASLGGELVNALQNTISKFRNSNVNSSPATTKNTSNFGNVTINVRQTGDAVALTGKMKAMQHSTGLRGGD